MLVDACCELLLIVQLAAAYLAERQLEAGKRKLVQNDKTTEKRTDQQQNEETKGPLARAECLRDHPR